MCERERDLNERRCNTWVISVGIGKSGSTTRYPDGFEFMGIIARSSKEFSKLFIHTVLKSVRMSIAPSLNVFRLSTRYHALFLIKLPQCRARFTMNNNQSIAEIVVKLISLIVRYKHNKKTSSINITQTPV